MTRIIDSINTRAHPLVRWEDPLTAITPVGDLGLASWRELLGMVHDWRTVVRQESEWMGPGEGELMVSQWWEE